MTTTELYECWVLAGKGNGAAQMKLANYYISKFPNNVEVYQSKNYYLMYLHLTL